MGICYLMQNGGGASLNFKVIGNPMPSTAKENTIWIDTDVPITSYIFSATQQTGSAGMVWISTGTSSTVAFNALKKNGIQVYPISAKQYVGGAWKTVTAQSYIGGQWVQFSSDWEGELYEPGNKWESVTGGWKGTATIDSNGIVTLNGTSGFGKTFYTSKTISKGTATKLRVNVTSFTDSGGALSLVATKTNSSPESAGSEDNMYGYVDIRGKGTFDIPLSGITKPFYVYLYTYDSCTAKINKIWLE